VAGISITVLDEEWKAALADAEIDASTARFYPFLGASSNEAAILLYPGTAAYADERFPVEAEPLADANRHQEMYRVGTYIDCEVSVLAGNLRHELEHARQHRAHGQPIFDLGTLVQNVVARRFGGRPGGGYIYGLLPHEHDANAAAARHVAQRHHDEAERLLAAGHPAAGLFRSLTGPGPMDTLPARIVAFAYLYADLADAHAADRGTDFASLLDTMWAGAGQFWRRLGSEGGALVAPRG
jgi:hypothetical protein